MENALLNSTALHVAIYFDLETVVRVLLPYAGAALSFGSGPRCLRRTPVHVACDLGRTAILKLLLQTGSDANELDLCHRMPLFKAY